MKTKAQLYKVIIDLLTLKQFKQTMGGDMSYDAKARKIMSLTKSRKIQALCAELLEAPVALDALQRDNANRAARGELIGE
jgi:hypothetical protein